MKAVAPERWRKAQHHEFEFWRRWREIPPYRDLDLPQYWAGERARFALPEGFFTGRRVLDVGCGPVGLIHFLPEAGCRIRLDPLLRDYSEKLELPEPGLSMVSRGERLPLPSEAVEVAICFNALDHMQDPQAALQELARVLRPGGTALLMVHTFPPWTLPLLWGDRLHPHHWTSQEFLQQVASHLSIVRSTTVRRAFQISLQDCFRPSCWKYVAASLVLSATYVVARREEKNQPPTNIG